MVQTLSSAGEMASSLGSQPHDRSPGDMPELDPQGNILTASLEWYECISTIAQSPGPGMPDAGAARCHWLTTPGICTLGIGDEHRTSSLEAQLCMIPQ